MCQTVLVRGLLDSTDISRKIELGTICRLTVLHDVVGQSVFELSFPYGRIIRQHLILGIRRERERRTQSRK